MDTNTLILKQAARGELTVAEIVKVTGFSRTYIHRLFQSLVESGRLVKFGSTKQSRYILANSTQIEKAKNQRLSFTRTFSNSQLAEDRVLELIRRETGIFSGLKDNVGKILEYAFTEMLNNAIEHSHSEKIKVTVRRDEKVLQFGVVDWGVGIFENLIHKRHLASVQEAIQDLLKGKQTTAPAEHTGEGIFFTRRIADNFIIRSADKKLWFNNQRADFTLATIRSLLGTRIGFAIATDTTKQLSEVFRQYATEAYEFGVTEVMIRLYQVGGARDFISRSQARRVLFGLEKFKKIILDFAGVATIGQGFADEVFRVWQKRFPGILLMVENANPDVQFMLANAGKLV